MQDKTVDFHNSRPVFFNLFLIRGTLQFFKKIGGTLTWLKMAICGILCNKNINKNAEIQNWRHP
jgi:hypothetical protein